MSQPVANWWARRRDPSRVVGMGTRVSGTGAYDINTRAPLLVPQRRYVWGARLDKGDLAAMGANAADQKRMAGMVNFRGAGRGGAAHSTFLSFRVMSEKSRGWIKPAVEGHHVARTVADQLRPLAEPVFRRAMEEDVKALIGG